MDTKHCLIDVDGVAADIVKASLKLIGQENNPEYIYQYCQTWNIWDNFDGWEQDTILHCVHQPYFWENMPLIPNVKKGIKFLKQQGYKITWVTAPTWECYGWCDARVEWLWKHFGQEHNIILSHEKKDISGDIFIDDKQEYYLNWINNWPNKKAFLFNAPYNNNITIPTYNWLDIIQAISEK